MKHPNEVVFRVKRLASLCATLVASGVLFSPGHAMAQVYTMNNGGSTATVNVGNTGVLGMNSWSVGGVSGSQLNQQWFWYSVNNAVQQPINTISGASVYNFSSPASPIDDLGVQYQNAQLTVQVEYVLTGNGPSSGSADMAEKLSIVNNSASSISLSFYQYSNFNLFQNNLNSVSLSSGPGGYTGATQTTGGPDGNGIAEVIDAPLANYGEAALVGQTLGELNGPSYYTLNDNASAGPGDVSWAFQWNVNLGAGDTFNITKDKGLSIQLVPEPSTLAFIVMGIGAFGLSLRRKTA
ncbi:MAG: PEP-CTERM sorting domain-containing protein [Verrucomicrobiota bacterium]|jgi:hypothetical protein